MRIKPVQLNGVVRKLKINGLGLGKVMAEMKSLFEEERVFYARMSPRGKRNMTIFVDKLTPEQKKRVFEVEAFLLEVAEDASDETRTALKGK